MSPTARSLAHLRGRGAIAGVVERWNHFARIRQDFFGFADLLAVQPGEPGVTAVQVTTVSNQAKRVHKIAASPYVRAWLEAGNRVVVHGWAKGGARGKRKTWTLSVTPITQAELVPTPAPRPGAEA